MIKNKLQSMCKTNIEFKTGHQYQQIIIAHKTLRII